MSSILKSFVELLLLKNVNEIWGSEGKIKANLSSKKQKWPVKKAVECDMMQVVTVTFFVCHLLPD